MPLDSTRKCHACNNTEWLSWVRLTVDGEKRDVPLCMEHFAQWQQSLGK